MIIVMKAGAKDSALRHAQERLQEFGLTPHLIVGAERTILAATGKEKPGIQAALEALEGVEKVMSVLAPYKMASKESRKEPTVVKVREFVAGGDHVGVVAGPCSVESRQQILEMAKLVKSLGATALRGGAYKPRTSPYSFQGLKEKGLEFLAEAREATGLAIFTEVMAPELVPVVAKVTDVLQIGARNMQNYPLLEAAGESGLPVLLKRGPSATIEELLLAAEYVLKTGNPNVILCERGIRTFEDHTRFTLPLATVPYLQEKSHLPVMVDPSHGTGKATLVGPMARAAIAAGADALMMEIHEDPEHAMSDGFQALTPPVFSQVMAECRKVSAALGRTLG
ncbi:MAG: 3-deoxy-7-phosphoheptulonate synthase [Planctomycetota bacterium]